jgi:autotransporter-associated beta strand protein
MWTARVSRWFSAAGQQPAGGGKRQPSSRRDRSRGSARAGRRRLAVEPLEDRTLLAAALHVQIGDAGVPANPSTTVPTLVRITDPVTGVKSVDFTIAYDTSRLNLATSDITVDPEATSKGFSCAANVNAALGEAYVTFYRPQALSDGTLKLADINFHVRTDALSGAAPLTFVAAEAGDNDPMDPVNGSIIVSGARTWTGGSAVDDNWSTAANWSGNVAPGPGDDVVFVGPSRPTPYNNTSVSPLHSIAINGSFALSGNGVTLAPAGPTTPTIQNNFNAANSLAMPVTLAADSAVQISTGSLAMTGPIDNGGHLLTVDTAPTTAAQISGGITGGGGLNKTGTGALQLGGTNDYMGGTTVAAGSLTFVSAAALPAGQNLTVSGNAVVIFSSGYSGPITAGGAGSAAPAALATPESPALMVAQAAPATAPQALPPTTAGDAGPEQALSLVVAAPPSAAAKPSVAAALSSAPGRSPAGAKLPARSSAAGATRQLAPALLKPTTAATVHSAAAIWNSEQFATAGQPTKKARAIRAQVVDLALAKWWR